MELTLVRHTAVDVPPGVCYGQTDVPLKPTFGEEASVVRTRLQAYAPFDAVFTSPLTRCTRLASYCGYPDARQDSRLLELNFGAWEMQAYDAIDDPRLQEWYADYLHVQATGGESFVMQLARVSQFLDELSAMPYQHIAIFAHGGVLACAQIYAGLVDLANAFSAVPPYGGIVHIPHFSGHPSSSDQ